MRVIFTCGGTGGHINPAIAVAKILKERKPNSEILFVGADDGMETELVPREGFAIETVHISNYLRSLTPSALWHNAKAVFIIRRALRRADRIIKEFKPDVILGTGGYASYPILRQGVKNGIPTALQLNLIKPEIPTQHVDDFTLGRDLGIVGGDWDLLAPLGLKAGSQIIYADNVDGWNDEDLDHCTIEKLNVSFVVSTDIPVSVALTGYPIDTEGNQIKGADGKPVTIEGATVPANAQNVTLNVQTSGVIPSGRGLDGIRFVATARAEKDGQTLSPGMKFTLSNIRASVTGYYIKDLDD